VEDPLYKILLSVDRYDIMTSLKKGGDILTTDQPH